MVSAFKNMNTKLVSPGDLAGALAEQARARPTSLDELRTHREDTEIVWGDNDPEMQSLKAARHAAELKIMEHGREEYDAANERTERRFQQLQKQGLQKDIDRMPETFYAKRRDRPVRGRRAKRGGYKKR